MNAKIVENNNKDILRKQKEKYRQSGYVSRHDKQRMDAVLGCYF